MSELVALCFDADASPSIGFESAQPDDTTLASGASLPIYGWGVGWYPSSERGASVIKDPKSSGESRVSDALGDWHRFRSTIFVCHARGHPRSRQQQDAQPFVRSYGGRQWIFAHDGDLAADWPERLPLRQDPAFEPLGRTDSEHAFCWLLARLHAQDARALADVSLEALQAWMQEINAGGQLNVLLTDGEYVCAYRDAAGKGGLHWTRRIPPHPSVELVCDAVRISLEDPEDSNRTALVFASTPLTADPWRALAPGELILARRGSILWDSEPIQPPARAEPEMQPPPSQSRSWVEAGQELAAAAPMGTDTATSPTPSGARILSISHHTRYEYEQLVERSSHRLLLRPVEDRGQELLDYSLDIQPAGRREDYEDVFGNAAVGAEIDDSFASLEISSHATVRVRALPPLEHRAAHRNYSIPLTWMPWQREMLSAYLMPPELPETQLHELSEYTMSFVERNDYDLVSTLLDLNETLYRDVAYVSGSTTNETTPFEVFQSRQGVCQDFANLMICLARLLHVPARYRMGYIFTGADYANKIQSEASHAWVELYIPRVGWHGFDPTNGVQVGSGHVRVACGRNYRDATPTTGTIYRGGGTELLSVGVRVEEVPG